LLGDLFDAANKIAEIFGVKEKGFRLIFNCGPDGGQEVYHLHMHLLAGKKLGF
ncbi:MAG: HIT domain-containing protein, partial [Ignavibacteriaceae bacterium]|nr:HIT domain-containing protein [Ignavibacteriaceae bacterium]